MVRVGDVLQAAIIGGAAYLTYIVFQLFALDDLQYLGCAVVAMCAFRVLTPLLISRHVFNMMKPDFPPDKIADARSKFGSHVNKFLLHTLLQVWGLQIVYSQDWFKSWTDLSGCFEGWDPKGNPIGGDFRHYYLAELAFFGSSFIMQFVEHKSHDHIAMMAHHVGASALIALSFVYNTHRIGLIVLVVREVTDILIHFARALSLLQFKTPSELVLVLLTILWLPTRCLHQPFVILPAALQSPTYEWNFPMWVTFNGLLGALIPLDYYYFILAISALIRRVRYPHLKNIDPDAKKLS